MTAFTTLQPRSISVKRSRSDSISSSSSTATASSSGSRASRGNTPSLTEQHPSKFHRTPEVQGNYICCLPPTCHQPSTVSTFTSQGELDLHQERLHSHVCRVLVRDRDREKEKEDRRGGMITRSITARGKKDGEREEEVGRDDEDMEEEEEGEGVDREREMTWRHSVERHDQLAGAPTEGDFSQEVNGHDDAARLPAAFKGGRGQNRRKECGKVFPDERFLTLVSSMRCTTRFMLEIKEWWMTAGVIGRVELSWSIPNLQAPSFQLSGPLFLLSSNTELTMQGLTSVKHHNEVHDSVARAKQAKGGKIVSAP